MFVFFVYDLYVLPCPEVLVKVDYTRSRYIPYESKGQSVNSVRVVHQCGGNVSSYYRMVYGCADYRYHRLATLVLIGRSCMVLRGNGQAKRTRHTRRKPATATYHKAAIIKMWQIKVDDQGCQYCRMVTPLSS